MQLAVAFSFGHLFSNFYINGILFFFRIQRITMELTANFFLLLFCTCPNQEVAENLATQVISNSLAGCVNILPHLQSIYRWQGEIVKEQEQLLIIKTHKDCYPQLEQLIKEIHPYQIPEIVAIPLEYGSLEYLTWLKHSLK